jgi:hypothetical protein
MRDDWLDMEFRFAKREMEMQKKIIEKEENGKLANNNKINKYKKKKKGIRG